MRFAALLFAALPALCADVSGKWDFHVDLSAGSGTASYEFKQEGEKLTGTYTGLLGTAKLTGTVRGNEIRFGFTASYDGEAVPVQATGTIENDKSMKGTVQYGPIGEGTFRAVRKGN